MPIRPEGMPGARRRGNRGEFAVYFVAWCLVARETSRLPRLGGEGLVEKQPWECH